MNRHFLNRHSLLLPLLIVSPLLISAPACAQVEPTGDGDDFGLDFSVAVEKKLAKGFDFDIGLNYRTQDNSSRTERWGLEAGLSYRFFQTKDKRFNLKGGISFEQIWRQKLSVVEPHYKTTDDEEGNETYVLDSEGNRQLNGYNGTDRYWRARQRYSASVEATWKPNKRWTFELKETFQWSHYCTTDSVDRDRWRYNDDDELYLKRTERKVFDNKDRLVLRSKVTVTYDIKGLPLDPFVSADYGCGLNYTSNKWRFTGGADYKFSKQHKVTLFYRYSTENSEDETDGHLIGLGYKFSF